MEKDWVTFEKINTLLPTVNYSLKIADLLLIIIILYYLIISSSSVVLIHRYDIQLISFPFLEIYP